MIPDPQALTQNLTPVFESASVILFILGGAALMLPSRGKGNAIWFLILAVICAVLSSMKPQQWTALYQWVSELPIWVTIIVGGFLALRLLGLFASLFLGRQASANMVGDLAAGLIRVVFATFILPFRVLRRMMRGYIDGP